MYVLTLALSRGRKVEKHDVNTVFLKGDIQEAFMTQSEGFVSEQFTNHVCKLKKVIYSLRQTPRAWFLQLSGCLQQMEFKGSNFDASMILYNKNGNTVIFLIYVNDILVT